MPRGKSGCGSEFDCGENAAQGLNNHDLGAFPEGEFGCESDTGFSCGSNRWFISEGRQGVGHHLRES
jgi:hypothetical protein